MVGTVASGGFCIHVPWWNHALLTFAATQSSLEPLHLTVNKVRAQQRYGKSKWQKKRGQK